MTKEIYDLFCEIAIDAMERGKDFSLEKKAYLHDAKGIGGLGGGHTDDTGVILRVWQAETTGNQPEDPEEYDYDDE